MTATFWTGSSLSFTNGSKTVTVNTGPSLDSVKANSSLTAGNYNEPVEVKSVSGNTITLYSNWPGSTGTTSATIKPSAAAAASAGVAAQQLITEIQGLVGSASSTATANSFVKRDSSGRIKAAAPSTNDDVVNKGYLGTAARETVTTSPSDTTAGRLLKVGDFGLGVSVNLRYPSSSIDDSSVPSGIYRVDSTFTGTSPATVTNGTMIVARYNSAECSQTLVGTNAEVYTRFYFGGLSTWSDWRRSYDSGNTNFNEFGGNGGSDIICPTKGFAESPGQISFLLPINSPIPATGISVQGSFRLFNVKTGVYEDEGVVPVFNVGGLSSNKAAYITFTTVTGKTRGDIYLLASSTSSTGKIKVNF